MNAQAATAEERATVCGVTPDMVEELLQVLPEEYLQYSEERDELALPTVMRDVGWDAYDKIITIFGDQSLRHIYDCGTLELIMSPLEEHDWTKKFLGRMIESLTLLLDIPVKSVGSTSLKRMRIYAAMRVPEIWRHDGTTLHFHLLDKQGRYVESDRSLAFPFIRPADLERFLNELHEADETTVMKSFIAWARRRVRAYRKGV